METEA
jgi:hypothetical protein